jgi:phosphate uptake regulator|tara:strand:+ start:2881 stop:3867 length:987 start_codon:yes stop_codon:yes gene_type:complete
MESRKLQKTGGSTLIVSLPKKWITKNKLDAGSEVRLTIQPDGTINIDPGTSDINKKISTVKCNNEESQHLFRDLIGVYLAGGTEIKVIGSPRLTVEERKTIRKFSASVIGLEIIEEEATQAILIDMSNPGALPLRTAIKRLYKIVSAMYNDSILILEGSKDLAADVVDRDKEADKLQWFIERQLNMMLDDSSLSRQLEATSFEGVIYSNVARYLERIADHACRLAEIGYVAGLIPGRKMLPLAKDAGDIMKEAMMSFINNDPRKATVIIDKGKKTMQKAQTYFENKSKKEIEHPLEFSIAIDAIMRTIAYSTDISEAAINYSAKKENK